MKKPIRNYLKIVNEFINVQSPFDVEILGSVHYDKSYPIISFHNHSKLAKYNIVINAGAHGEESVAVRVLLRFLQEFNKDYLNTYNFKIFPIINPYGYTYNKRRNGNNQYGNTGFNIKEDLLTPEGRIIKDAVPTRVDLFIDVHGDCNKSGFYIYERKRPNMVSIAEESLQTLANASLPILKDATVYREPCCKGVITRPEKDGSMDQSMFERGAIYSLCLEIPLKAPEDQQIIGGLMLLNRILEKFKERR